MPRKAVIVFRPRKNDNVTIKEVMSRMDQYRSRHPDRDVFFDGDHFAVCYVRK